MENIDNKIIELLSAVSPLSENEEQKISWYVVQVAEEEKKKILMAVFKRYEDFKSNSTKLTKGLQKAFNNLDESLEKRDADKVLLEI